MVKQALSVDQVDDEHFYSVFSRDDFLGPGCGDDPFLLQDYLRFHSGDADLMRDPAHTGVPCFDASEEKMAKLASDSPYVATESCFRGDLLVIRLLLMYFSLLLLLCGRCQHGCRSAMCRCLSLPVRMRFGCLIWSCQGKFERIISRKVILDRVNYLHSQKT